MLESIFNKVAGFHVFSSEFCEILKNTFFIEQLLDGKNLRNGFLPTLYPVIPTFLQIYTCTIFYKKLWSRVIYVRTLFKNAPF